MSSTYARVSLGELIRVLHGFAFKSEYFSNTGEVVLLTPGNYQSGGGYKDLGQKQKYYGGPIPDTFILKPGDLLMAMTEQAPGLLGSTLEVPRNATYLHNQRLGKIQIQAPEKLDKAFLFYALNSTEVHREIAKTSTGTKVKHTSPEKIYRVEIYVPPLPDQRRIVSVLRTWDKAIDVLENLRGTKSERLRGIVQKLTNNAATKRDHLRAHIRELSERNRDQRIERVLSVTNTAGFVLAETQFAHRVASANLSNYKLVRHGQYAYNPSRINVGSIARLDDWDEGALSPMYVVFEVDETLNSDYLRHWLSSSEARQRIRLAAQGSVRETVSFGDLGSISISVPSLDEQKRIAKALNAGSKEINLLDKEIYALQSQKRGLMQKLLTGEWRLCSSGNELGQVVAHHG